MFCEAAASPPPHKTPFFLPLVSLDVDAQATQQQHRFSQVLIIPQKQFLVHLRPLGACAAEAQGVWGDTPTSSIFLRLRIAAAQAHQKGPGARTWGEPSARLR